MVGRQESGSKEKQKRQEIRQTGQNSRKTVQGIRHKPSKRTVLNETVIRRHVRERESCWKVKTKG